MKSEGLVKPPLLICSINSNLASCAAEGPVSSLSTEIESCTFPGENISLQSVHFSFAKRLTIYPAI